MGFCEVLTIAFIVLKIIGTIDWSWWLVLLPEIIALGFYILILVLNILTVAQTRKVYKRIDNRLKRK